MFAFTGSPPAYVTNYNAKITNQRDLNPASMRPGIDYTDLGHADFYGVREQAKGNSNYERDSTRFAF